MCQRQFGGVSDETAGVRQPEASTFKLAKIRGLPGSASDAGPATWIELSTPLPVIGRLRGASTWLERGKGSGFKRQDCK